jgi:hypothetical protein
MRDLEGGLTGDTISEKKLGVSSEPERDGVPNTARITFAPDPRHTVNEKGALRIAGPCESDNGS